MTAIAIHFLGFYIVNWLMPAWAAEVDGELASVWYCCFVIVDLLAMLCADRSHVFKVLALSCAWSACLAVETFMLEDGLQRLDLYAQWAFDMAFALCVGMIAIEWMRNRNNKRMVG